MGKLFSKHIIKKQSEDNNDAKEDYLVKDDEYVLRLKEELSNNIEDFILNNLLLSFQFFENFDREMKELRINQVTDREMLINSKLSEHKKHCLLPDTIAEIVDTRVTFRPSHGPNKYQPESLLPQRMYISHDNIEILHPDENSDYSSVDGPIRKAKLEPSKGHKGFFNLQQIEILDIQGQAMNNDSEQNNQNNTQIVPEVTKNLENLSKMNPRSSVPSSPVPKIYNKNIKRNSLSSPLPKDGHFKFGSEQIDNGTKSKIIKSHSFSHSKSYINSENIKLQEPEEEYEYTTVTRLSTPKPLNEMIRRRTLVESSTLPDSCVTSVKVAKDYDSDDDNENKNTPPLKKKEKRLERFETRHYFNSMEFSLYFQSVFYNIYEILGLSKESVDSALQFRDTIIQCNQISAKGDKIVYEIIPAVTTPPETACEWLTRERSRLDPFNRPFEFPSSQMIKKLRTLHGNILPIGFLPKRGTNDNAHLQWSLSFPAAERYIESYMSHTQIKCYLFITALYKTFMQPPNIQLGLAPHHIRNFIFWECEYNYRTWPEDRMWTKIKRLLQKLYDHLSNATLKDYFVPSRNLFESSPTKYLRISQKKLLEIRERPLVHMIAALRNLRYKSGTFYPTIDFKKIYGLLTDKAMLIVNTNLVIANELLYFDDEDNTTLNTAKSKTIDKGKNFKRKLRQQYEEEKRKKENEKVEKRESVDSINLQTELPKKLDEIQKRTLLEMFINHFNDIGKKCYYYESYLQAMFYFKHSLALATVLGDYGEMELGRLKLNMKDSLEKCKEEIKKMHPPEVPRRDSRYFPGATINVQGFQKLNIHELQNNMSSEDRPTRNTKQEQDKENTLKRQNKPEPLKIHDVSIKDEDKKGLETHKEENTIQENFDIESNSKKELSPRISICLHYDTNSTDL